MMSTSLTSSTSDGANLTRQALELRVKGYYAGHPVEEVLEAFLQAGLEGFPDSQESKRGLDFRSAEYHYRSGAQGLSLSKIPELPQTLASLSRLGPVDRAGRKALRHWSESENFIQDHETFTQLWSEQEQMGGAEHHVYFEEASNRWFKRLYNGVNDSILGEYLVRMRLHKLLFPETGYRLEGFSIHPKTKDLTPVVSQPHVNVDTEKPPVTKEEINDLMGGMGFEPVLLKYEDILDDGYYAYYQPQTGVLAHDLHDENVVRMEGTGELAVIDPYISLARRGSWAALKLAEVGIAFPEDDPI